MDKTKRKIKKKTKNSTDTVKIERRDGKRKQDAEKKFSVFVLMHVDLGREQQEGRCRESPE